MQMQNTPTECRGCRQGSTCDSIFTFRCFVVAFVACVAEIDEEMFVLLEHVVVNDFDLDVTLRFSRLEDESPGRELEV